MQRILIVDDEPLIREVLEAVLADEGYAVETAPDGRAALDLVDSSMPDLVISDVRMPRLTGWELLAQVRQRSPKLPVILISATTDTAPPGAMQVPDHAAFLAKPFDIDDLLSLVVRLTSS